MKSFDPNPLILFSVGLVFVLISLWGVWDYLPFGLGTYEWQTKDTLIWKLFFFAGVFLVGLAISNWFNK